MSDLSRWLAKLEEQTRDKRFLVFGVGQKSEPSNPDNLTAYCIRWCGESETGEIE